MTTDRQPPEEDPEEAPEEAPAAPDAPSAAVAPFDAEEYRKYLDDIEGTEEQKLEFLRTLWWIMSAFVELGFNVDPVQQLIPAFLEAASKQAADEVEGTNPDRNPAPREHPGEDIDHGP